MDHCSRGHEMNDDNAYHHQRSGRRFCRECNAERNRVYRRIGGAASSGGYYHPRHDSSDSWVYFIGDGAGHVKIGVAVDVESRLATLQTGNAHELTVLAIEQGGYGLEGWYHRRFAEHRVRRSNEWFVLAPDIAEWIDHLNRLL